MDDQALDLAATEELLAELAKRCVSVLVVWTEKARDSAKGDEVCVFFDGGRVDAIGLAHVGVAKLTEELLSGDDDEEEE